MPQFQMTTTRVPIPTGSPSAEADMAACSGPRSCDLTSIRDATGRAAARGKAFDVACRFLRRNHGPTPDRVQS